MSLFTFTSLEKRDLLVGTTLFVIVEITLLLPITELLANLSLGLLMELIILAILSAPLFVGHELAHKFVAQGNNLHSEFRLLPDMALISLFSIFFPVKIIAPGVVISSGRVPDQSTEARISMAGPLVNLFLGGAFLVVYATLFREWSMFLFISKFSFDLAFFNLLPFLILDGAKVLRWDAATFWTLFAIAAACWACHPLGVFRALWL